MYAHKIVHEPQAGVEPNGANRADYTLHTGQGRIGGSGSWEPIATVNGSDPEDLDEEFDFDEIEMEGDTACGQDERQQAGTESEEKEAMKINDYLWGETSCTFNSLVSVIQVSVALDGLAEKIVAGEEKPIYSTIDLREVENQREICARDKFLAYRKLMCNYRISEPKSQASDKGGPRDAMVGRNSLLHAASRFYISLVTHSPCPQIISLLRTMIYDLNAPNTIYRMSNCGTSGGDNGVICHNPYLLRDLDGLAYLRPPICYGEDGYNDASGDMGESYKKWKRKMQILDKETRLALVNMGKSLEDIESTYMQMENRKTTNSVLEFYQMTQIFGKVSKDSLCNHSFDEIYNSKYPYQGAFEEADLSIRPIMHSRIALNLTGTQPVCGKGAKISMARFHRPDFREGIFKAHLQYIRGGADPSGIWALWRSRGPLESTVLSRYRQGDYDAGDLPLGMYMEGEKEETNLTHHPANYFLEEFDLSLSDDCSFAVLEYVEQFPFYLSNPGMASRVSRYLPTSGGPTGEAEDGNPNESAAAFDMFRDNARLLGPLGMVHKRDGIDMFGVMRKVRYGMAVIENHLYRAPIFHHPLPQNVTDGTGTCTNTNCDFLLIRRSWWEDGERRIAIFLRQLVPMVRSDSCGDYEGGALYTVGQCEPKLEVPAPDSKVYYEDMKNLIRAWVARRVSEWPEGTADFKRLREEAKATFCPHVPDRDVAQIVKSVEGQPSPEAARPIKPETVCLLESARAALQRLQLIGISSLQTVDRLASILMLIEEEERECDNRDRNAREFRRQLQIEYEKRTEALGIADMARGPRSDFPADFTVSLYGHLGPKHFSPLVRFVEEALKLTPWNITRDCRLVLSNKGSAQFMLYGFADPSGGRGEAINLLKRQNKDAQHFRVGSVAGTLEDLRKLSMPELRKRLLKYGVSDQVISSLPRWDQVALVRQYRSGFGIAGDGADDFKFRLAPEEYQRRINQILDRQHLALALSDPAVDEEAALDGSSSVGDQGLELDDLVDELAGELDEAVGEGTCPTAPADAEERELSILRQRQEVTAVTTEEKWRDAERYVPVPGIMWLRRDRGSSTEEFANERAVFVYGRENIEKFIEWRRKRGALDRKHPRAEDDGSGESKRLCRVCGQPGHIASNIKCPFYREGNVRVERNRKEPRSLERGEGFELLSSLDVLSEASLLDVVPERERGGGGPAVDSDEELGALGRRRGPRLPRAPPHGARRSVSRKPRRPS